MMSRAGVVALCCDFQVAHAWPAPVPAPSPACNGQGAAEARVLQPQSVDIGARWAAMAATRHLVLVALLTPGERNPDALQPHHVLCNAS
jgi:hypothetical protein